MLGFEGEYQSMRSAPCASAPSHPLHAMPPRITRNSDRPRASDRTMVNIRPACRVFHARCFAYQLRRKLTRWTTSRTSSGITKHSGLDREKQSPSSGRGGAFFLTFLFIELIITLRLAFWSLNFLDCKLPATAQMRCMNSVLREFHEAICERSSCDQTHFPARIC
jgi:hypothetical protein